MLICFTPSFHTAATLSSHLNITLDIRPIEMIFGSYLL